MSQRVQVLVGTKKGAFIIESDTARRTWTTRGPFCDLWPIHHFIRTSDGTLFAGGGNPWYGATVFRSADDGSTWTQSSRGIDYGADGPKMRSIWHVAQTNGTLYVGAEPAGLFRSDDSGQTWLHVAGLREHPSQPEWEPGAGGLILHSIVPHPTDAERLWIAISAAGTFETTDGGQTWATRNKGVRADFIPGPTPEFGHCVHKLKLNPAEPDTLYQQNHCGVYRSDDGGREWVDLSPGLPSEFGFPLQIHPHDPSTIYVIPHAGPEDGRQMVEGHAQVFRSRDRGESWQPLDKGLPHQNAYLTVLREAMAADSLDRAGIYFGTSAGHLFASSDEGDSWQMIADYLPSIWSVEVAVVDD
ncbi:MAG TPA: hypothetical protein VEX62_09125 [Candidatus Limnocylindrales bacterium]|nr:hypothetical protein [Candidatus Limnocylindrales bacterium]